MSQVPNTSPSNADYDVENSTGANVRGDLNNILDAILTMNSGGSSPSYAKAYTLWADTSAGTMKIRNAANNDWIELFQLDGTLTLEDGSASTPGLAFRDDLNTGIFSSAADTFNVATGGVERMELGATTIFNEDGADVDFRIEGDTDANLFYVDAGNDRVGIGTSSPLSALHVKGSGTTTLRVDNSDDGTASLTLGNTGSSNLVISQTSSNATFSIGGSERMRIDSSGRVLIGSTSALSHGGIESHLQVLGTGTDDSSITLSRFSNNVHSPYIAFAKSRNGSVGGNTVVQSGDSIGRMTFFGNDGTDGNTPAAEIDVEVDGTPGSNDMPGRIVFRTTSDGASSVTERMRIDSTGRVGIGLTNPSAALDVSTSDAVVAEFQATGGSGGYIGLFTGASGAAQGYIGRSGQLVGVGGTNENLAIRSENEIEFAINTSGTVTTRAKITVNGIETTSTIKVETAANLVNPLTIDDSINNNFNTNAAVFRKGSTGEVGSISCNRSGTTYNTTSDYRLKENVVSMSDGITRLKTLKPYRFNFISDSSTTVDGFFAHEVTAVPEAVKGTKDEVATEDIDGKNIKKGDPIYQQIDHSKLVPLLVAAVQELITKVETLEAA